MRTYSAMISPKMAILVCWVVLNTSASAAETVDQILAARDAEVAKATERANQSAIARLKTKLSTAKDAEKVEIYKAMLRMDRKNEDAVKFFSALGMLDKVNADLDTEFPNTAKHAIQLDNTKPSDSKTSVGGTPSQRELASRWFSRMTTDQKKSLKNNGNSYYMLFLDANRKFKEAKEACEAMGGNLVCIETKEEDEFLKSEFGRSGFGVLLGGVHDGKEWKWINGKPMTYQNFKAAEGTCMRLSVGEWKWCGTTETDKVILGYICEWELTK